MDESKSLDLRDVIANPRLARMAIDGMRYRGIRLDGTHSDRAIPSMAAAGVRHILTALQHNGYSAEDTMTVLAYWAICELDNCFDRQLDFVNTNPITVLMTRPEPTP